MSKEFLIMPKLALFLSAFFLLILFQQSSYGFIEGAEVPILSNFDIERTSDIISIDLSSPGKPGKKISGLWFGLAKQRIY